MRGRFETYQVQDVFSKTLSFLEMFDVLNERFVNEGKILLHLTMTAAKEFGACSM